MTDNTANNKRIAKNTLMLYIRMFLMMVVTLYTSRVVLQQLGVEDFGVYNVVGGLVSTFSILTNSLSSACSRFINFELGTGNFNKLKSIVSTSFNIQIYLSIAVLLVSEALGPWFMNAYMDIPDNRLTAANWVLQFSIVTFIVKLIMVPLNALIVSHERMGVYAYFSIIEVVLQLLIVYLLDISNSDKLIIYSFLIFAVSIIVFSLYLVYCLRQFMECSYTVKVKREDLKVMSSFAGWNFVGSTAGVLRNQGIDIIVNMFFGVVMNAARGIANQVNTALGKFTSSFMTALNPQITKSYAAGDVKRLEFLVNQGSRFSYYLMLFLTVPVVFEMDYILHLWLKTVPNSAVLFSQLQLLIALVTCLSQPLITALLATGNIRNYQLLVGGISLLCFPVAYLALYMGASAYVTYIVLFISESCCLVTRCYMMQRLIGVPFMSFVRTVLSNVVPVTIIACILPLVIVSMQEESLSRFVLTMTMSMVSCSLTVYFCGLSKKERLFVLEKAKAIYSKFRNS